MHKIRALCPLIRTEPLQNATSGRRHERLQQGGVNGYDSQAITGDYFLMLAFSTITLYLYPIPKSLSV